MQKWSNNGISLLAAALAPADTTVLITGAHDSRFPVIVAPDFMECTIENSAGSLEIVKVTAHAASSGAFTVARGQQGTTALNWVIGDLIELRATALEMAAWEQDIDDLQSTRVLRASESGYSGTHDWSAATITTLATKLKISGSPVDPTDAMSLGSVQALISGGGTPANIYIWSLGSGPAARFSLERAERRARQLTFA